MFAEGLSRVLKYHGRIALQNVDPAIKFFSGVCKNHKLQQAGEKLNVLNRKSFVCKVLKNNERYCNSQAHKGQSLYVENLFSMRRVLEDSSHHTNTVVVPLYSKENLQIDKDDDLLGLSWSSMNNEDLLSNFKLLSFYAFKNHVFIQEPKYRNILETLSSRCSEFSDQELHNLMDCVALWSTQKKEPIYQIFCKVLDKECLKRMPNWSIDKLMLMNDQFYYIKMARLSEFTYRSLKRIGFKLKSLSPSQLIQFTFFMKINRRVPVPPYELEYYIEKHADKFTIGQLGIYLIALEQYDITIKNPNFTRKLLKRFSQNLDNVNESVITALLKSIHSANDKNLIEEINDFFKLLEMRVSNYCLATLVAIADSKRKLLIHNDVVMTKILEKFEKEMESPYMTLKYLAEIIFAISTFNYDPKTTTFYSSVNNKLLTFDSNDELKRNYPRIYVNIVSNMLQVNFYPEEALKRSMEREFLNKSCANEKHMLDNNYLLMDYFIKLEHPEYNGPRLDETLHEFLLKKFGAIFNDKIKSIEKIGKYGKLMNEVADTCKKILGSDSAIYLDTLLPQLARRFIVICHDTEANKFISPEEELSKIPRGEIKYAPIDGKKWYVLIIAPSTNVVRNTCRPNSQIAYQMRLLERIGYTPITIICKDWYDLSDEVEKEKYVRNILCRYNILSSFDNNIKISTP